MDVGLWRMVSAICRCIPENLHALDVLELDKHLWNGRGFIRGEEAKRSIGRPRS